jgi:5'-3' exonuclease
MGIPYYFYVITKTYNDIVTSTIPICNHLLIDFNGLIHPSSQNYLKTLTKPPKDLEKGILSAIWSDTQTLIKLVNPKNTVQIYIDGVAPLAKMNQQRRRRFMSVYRKKQLQVGQLQSPNNNISWDSNCISPGTTFMTKLHSSLRAHIRHTTTTTDLKYLFSSADQAGEGEHKLFEALVDKYGSPEEVKIIHGMDADLIMLSLFSHLKNLFLFRDQHQSQNNQSHQHQSEPPIVLNIDTLRKGIISELKNKYQWTISEEALSDSYSTDGQYIIETYSIVCFLLGNDFIPHSVAFDIKRGGLEFILTQAGILWNKCEMFKNTNQNNQINWSFLCKLLEVLGNYENDSIYNIVLIHSKKILLPDQDPLENYPLINHDPLEKQLLENPIKWKSNYYKYLFNTTNTTTITNSCELYLKGIQWTFDYYKRQSKDSLWYYPYGYAPIFRDLTNYLNINIEEFEKRTTTNNGVNFEIDKITQLLCILPKESIDCLPLKYHSLMNNERLLHLYPNEFKIQTFMKSKLWECNILLPPMNVILVKKIVDANL